MYKLFLTLRYLRKRRIAYFAIAAVTLCVAMVLIVMSVMGGFLDTIKTRARGLLGDIVIDNRRYQGFPLYDEFIAEVSKWPEIAKATPVIYTVGLVRFPTTDVTNFVQVVGIRLQDAYSVNAFKKSLFYERYYPGTTSLGPQRQALIGYDLQAAPVPLQDPETGEVLSAIPPPVLPPELQKAFTEARARGVVDDESEDTLLARMLRAAGAPPLPGVYDMVGEPAPPEYTGDELPGMIIGRDIIAQRMPSGKYRRYPMYPRGYLVNLTYWPMGIKGTADPTPRRQPFRYTDDSRTGIYEIDSKHVYCDFELLQKLLGWDAAERADESGTSPARCSQIQIKLADRANTREATKKLTQRLTETYHGYADRSDFDLDGLERQLIRDIQAKTWEESQEHIIAPVEKERILVTILFGIISLVAAVLVLCILYMIVLQKTRDIGIVKAIGGSSAGVASIFLFYGAAVGIVGSILGSVIGVLFVTHINEFQDFLIRLNPAWQVWDRSVYSFDEIPHTVRAADVVIVFVSAVVASTIGAFAAAMRAGTMHPVEALRYE